MPHLSAPAPHPTTKQVGQRYGLALLSPVDDAGRFTEEAGPFAGLNVQGDGNEAVVKVGWGCGLGAGPRGLGQRGGGGASKGL